MFNLSRVSPVMPFKVCLLFRTQNLSRQFLTTLAAVNLLTRDKSAESDKNVYLFQQNFIRDYYETLKYIYLSERSRTRFEAETRCFCIRKHANAYSPLGKHANDVCSSQTWTH